MSWRTAVAAAALVLGVSLTSGPMYRSSIGTAALQREVSEFCPVDVGLTIAAIPAPGPRIHFQLTSLDDLATTVPETAAPLTVDQTSPASMRIAGREDEVGYQGVVLHRDDQGSIITPAAGDLGDGDTLVPAEWATAVHVAVGDSLTFGADRPPLRIAGTYQSFDAESTASPWCGERTLFAPGPFGDPPNPVLLTNLDTIDAFHASGVGVTSTWQLPTRASGLHDDNVRAVEDALGRVPEHWDDTSTDQTISFFLRVHPGMLGSLADRADAVSEVIVRTVTPVQLAAAGACLVMLLASGTLLARQRRYELQLLVERGAPVPMVGRRVATSVIGPIAVGLATGFGLAWLGVRMFAPSPAISHGAFAQAAILATIGGVAALVVVTAAAAAATYRAVDPSPAHRILRFVPWELGPLAVAVVSWQRVHADGGVHLSGVEVRGGDTLAQAFPVLVIAAFVTAIARLTYFLVHRSRTAGARLPLTARLGVRRITGDVPATVAIVLAGALAAATFSVAVLLRDTATGAARDKAAAFVGADMAVDTAGDHEIPNELAAHATVVARTSAHAGDAPVDILAIDPGTFAQGATWNGKASTLSALLHRLAPHDGRVPAIVAGGQLRGAPIHVDRNDIAIDPIATFDSFPGVHGGAVLVVVDAHALSANAASRQVWLHSPPANAVALLQRAGFPDYGVQSPGRVFDAVSFLVIEWSFAGMQAFGLVIGSLVLLIQVLVVVARRRQREVGWVVTQRMGVTARAHRIAIVIELALPALVALAGGVAVALVAARLSVVPLDPRPELLPSSSLVVHAVLFAQVTVVVLLSIAAVAALAVNSLRRVDALEVIRGEQ